MRKDLVHEPSLRPSGEGDAAHTPGPWAVTPGSYGYGSNLCVSGADGFILAGLVADVPELTERVSANARLIALAPEMYEYIASSASGGCAAAQALIAKIEREPDPFTRPDLPGIFRDHSCWKCNDGEKPCVKGNPRDCETLHARND